MQVKKIRRNPRHEEDIEETNIKEPSSPIKVHSPHGEACGHDLPDRLAKEGNGS